MSFEETELYKLLDPSTPVTDDLCVKALAYLQSNEATEKKVISLQSSEDGSTYLHRLAHLPAATQDQLLPVIYQLYNMGMDLNIIDKKVCIHLSLCSSSLITCVWSLSNSFTIRGSNYMAVGIKWLVEFQWKNPPILLFYKDFKITTKII